MGKIVEKVKEKLTRAKDKVKYTTDKATDTAKKGMSSSTTASSNMQDRGFEEGGPGRDHEYGRKEDIFTGYKEKDPMTPAKIRDHEPPAVKGKMSEEITEQPGQAGKNAQEASERDRRNGMTEGTAGATETRGESEQGADGTNG